MRGQIMLLTVLALSGTILGATTIAGLLIVYQIRQSSDIVNSTKAIFAADAGLEWRLYKFFKFDSQACKDCPDGGACPQPSFGNGVSLQTACEVAEGGAATKIKSTGTSVNASRALEIVLQ